MGTFTVLISLLLSPSAIAEEDGLPAALDPGFSQPAQLSQPVEFSHPVEFSRPVDGSALEAPEDDSEWHPPPGYDQPTKKAPPPRFDLSHHQRTRKYLNSLCRLEPVAKEESSHARIQGMRLSRSAPRNKQGSLRLLLENYVDSFRFEAECETRRARNPKACDTNERIHKWQGSHEAWKQAKAKKSSLLKSQLEHRKRAMDVLKTEFYEFRDASQLNGKPESRAQAEKILLTLRNESSCGTRAVETR